MDNVIKFPERDKEIRDMVNMIFVTSIQNVAAACEAFERGNAKEQGIDPNKYIMDIKSGKFNPNA